MSYQVLARKWRPKSFAEMQGQQHVLQALGNALKQQRIHQAYLFTGERGVGKTTVARILAKCLNCETGITAEPCGQCGACQSIDSGRFLDLIEVDAASKTSVEDTRDMLDNVQYTPSQGRYKIFLIDEVHMLSGHSFNALLKTLEEPPPHVKFLLATTDPQKLPATVLSRCLQFHLKNLLPDVIEQHLATVLTAEKIPFEQTALLPIAHAAEGSMRDALSLLDQAIAFCNGELQQQTVMDMLGNLDPSTIQGLLTAFVERDTQALIQQVRALSEHTHQYGRVLEELITALHHIAMAQVDAALLPEALAQREVLCQFAKQFSEENIQLLYQIALLGRRDLPLAPNPQLGLEMTLLRMLCFQPQVATTPKTVPSSSATTPSPSKTNVSTKTAAVKLAATPGTKATTVIEKKQAKPKATANTTTQKSAQLITETQNWTDCLAQLQLTGMTQAAASHCTRLIEDEHHWKLVIEPNHSAMLSSVIKQRIEEAIKEHVNPKIRVRFEIGSSSEATPASAQQEKQNQQQQAAEKAIQQDNTVQMILEQFDGIIAPGSTEPVSNDT